MADTSLRIADPAFLADVIACFDDERRAIPARWLYDRAGSEWFERITALPEYYPTRTETAILADCTPRIARMIGEGGAVVEFGSGSSTKTPMLLEALRPEAYVPIDISGEFLRQSAAVLSDRFRDVAVMPLEADFTQPIDLPAAIAGLERFGFFPGSTIGNLVPRTAVDLLRSMRRTLGEGARLLIGMDRVKPLDVLLPAYDDAEGVTAAFNCNLLKRINRELDGDLPLDAFSHEARWNALFSRVEMHLVATRDIAFEVAGRRYRMVQGESIHTENSHKYSAEEARLLLRAGGWTPVCEWLDDRDWFAVILAEAEPFHAAP